MKKIRSIATKFRLTFLAIAIIPIILFGIVSYIQIRSSTIEDKENMLRTVAENKRATLETWIEELKSKNSQLRHIPELQANIPFLYRTSSKLQDAEKLPVSLIDRIFRDRISSKENYNGIYLLSTNGDVLYSYVKEANFKQGNFSGEKFFLHGKDYEYVSDIGISPFSRMKCFFISYPVRDEYGGLLAILVIETNLNRVYQILGNHTDIGISGNILLFDSEGSILYQGKVSQGPYPIGYIPSKGINTAIKEKYATGQFTDVNGKSVVGAYVFYPSQKWVIAVELLATEVLWTANLLLYINVILILIISFIILIVSRFFANKFADPIISMTRTATLVAQGDLREHIRLNSGDELGVLATSFNSMIRSLASINKGIQNLANEIGSSTNEIITSSREQEQITLQQSSAVSQTSSTSEELSISAKQVARSAQSIMKQVDGTASKIMFLSQKAQEIDKITTVINEVEHQIHLLSLNASIEAARAGEHGKGFGVVAGEIRKLSEKSHKQTLEIAQIIEDIQSAISSVVSSTEQAVNGVRSITISVQEQDTAIDQISLAMQEINSGMKQSIEGTKQTIASVERLKDVMNDIHQVVQRFRTE